MHWYYAVDDTRHGPIDNAQFEELVHAGTIHSRTLVWNETMSDWVAFGVLLNPDASAAGPGEASPDMQGQVQHPMTSGHARPTRTSFIFDGPGGDFFVLYLKNVVLTLITLGIYKFWAQVEIRRWIYQHTSFLRSRFDYHATGKERFIAFLKAMVILGPLLLLFVGLYHVLANGRFSKDEALAMCFYGFFLIIFFLRPLIVVGSMRFRLARTSWAGMRFRFSGTVKECYALYIRDFFLLIFTLGFYGSWHYINVRRFKAENSDLGGENFAFHGTGAEHFALMLGGYLVTLISFGIYLPWWIASIHRFHTNHLHFQGRPFKSHLTGVDVLDLALVGFLVTVCTLGIGIPWVIKKFVEAFINSTEYTGSVDLDALKGSYDKNASAFMDGLGEAGEALEALGDVFGG